MIHFRGDGNWVTQYPITVANICLGKSTVNKGLLWIVLLDTSVYGHFAPLLLDLWQAEDHGSHEVKEREEWGWSVKITFKGTPLMVQLCQVLPDIFVLA